MSKSSILEHISEHQLIVSVRTSSAEDADQVAEALASAGVQTIEFSVSTPQVFKLVEGWAGREDLVVGVSSVLNGEVAQRAINAGAQFVASSCFNRDVLTVCHNSDTVVMQGALTPTEIMTADSYGVDLIKLFPVDALGGLKYFRTLKEALPSLRLLPAGDVSADNVVSYVKAGAAGVIVDQGILDRVVLRAKQWDEVTARAQAVVSSLEQAKTPSRHQLEPAVSTR